MISVIRLKVISTHDDQSSIMAVTGSSFSRDLYFCFLFFKKSSLTMAVASAVRIFEISNRIE